MNDLISLQDIDKEILRKIHRSDYLEFVKYHFKKFKREEFKVNQHHRALASALMDVFNGKIKYLLINVPPRHTKTELAVKNFIPWCFSINPMCRFLHLSYSDGLALDNAQWVKNLMRSESYIDLYGDLFSLDKHKSDSKKLWYSDEKGYMYSTSSLGQVTGFGAGALPDDKQKHNFYGAIIIDDPLKAADALSDVKREAVNRVFMNTIKSRLNDPKKTPIIIIMQRLHEDDLSGFLLNGNSEFKFTHINLPAINEDGPSKYDPREIGEPIWKDMHSLEMLKKMEETDPLVFAGQYQQRPAPLEGNMVKKDWLKFYDEIPKFTRGVYISCDLNFKKEGNSYVVYSAYGASPPDAYLIDQVRGRWNFPEALNELKKFIAQFPDYKAVLVEDKANGPAMISSLNKEGFMSVIPIQADISKVMRLAEVSPRYQAGNVYYPDEKSCNWIKSHIAELLNFPNAKNDDRVDAETQFLNYMRTMDAVRFYDY